MPSLLPAAKWLSAIQSVKLKTRPKLLGLPDVWCHHSDKEILKQVDDLC